MFSPSIVDFDRWLFIAANETPDEPGDAQSRTVRSHHGLQANCGGTRWRKKPRHMGETFPFSEPIPRAGIG